MKRDITTLLTGASLEELREASQQADLLYREKASLYTEAFFAGGRDVFVAHILEPLSRELLFNAMVAMRSVSRLWCHLIDRLTHANFDDMSLTKHQYAYALTVFPHITSLRVHSRILEQRGDVVFRCIAHLEIIDQPNRIPVTSVKKYWSSLQTLKYRNALRMVDGIDTLAQLTHLEINTCAFINNEPDFSHMPLLRHLRIRALYTKLASYAVPASLTYLNSDRAAHFVNFTGRGRLAMHYLNDLQMDALERLAREAYFTGEGAGRFTGTWVKGRFTGYTNHMYAGMMHFFRGHYLDGKRCGMGEERLHVKELHWSVYIGEWSQGVKHGSGKLYSHTRNTPGQRMEKTFLTGGIWENGTHILEEGCEECFQ